ncbi:hypothetical protein HII17_09115 [Thalassotalea sp. M1531]|uniref:Lipoprotein n=1 Tax=Thalassotalea algicola TaxID=2716224 RepID=A0A7Y0LC41_9GAMM|nr:hypothetical protein [Thalassotalea algicola]NMP31721.1 hypothetical protein [Thalassotalea algicola]
MIKNFLGCLIVFLLTGCVTTDVDKSSVIRFNPFKNKEEVIFYHQDFTHQHKTNHMAEAIGHHGATASSTTAGNVYQNKVSLTSGKATKKRIPPNAFFVSKMLSNDKLQNCSTRYENQNFIAQICFDNSERYYVVIDKSSQSISCKMTLDAKAIFGKENKLFENSSLNSNISEDGKSIYLYSFVRAFGRSNGSVHYPGYIVSKNCDTFQHVILEGFPNHEVVRVREQEDGLVFLKSYGMYVRYNNDDKSINKFKPVLRSSHIYIDDKHYIAVNHGDNTLNLEIINHDSGEGRIIEINP